MNYKKIDMANWERKNEFIIFTKIMPSYYSFTVDIDVTETYHMLKEKKFKTFPAMLYAVNKALNLVPEFRLGYENHELVCYDNIYPTFPYFHESTHSCSILWLPVNDSFAEFHEAYKECIQKYGASTSYEVAVKNPAPKNIYNISMEHRIHFNSASFMPMSNSKEPLLNPIVMCGKLLEENGRMIMPVSLTLHHAVGDGYHASLFFNKIQQMYSSPEEWLN